MNQIDLWAAASAHSLKFRKDATLDQHHVDEYAVVDPLSKETRTLDEMKVRASNSSSRRYHTTDSGDKQGRRGAGGASGGGGGRDGSRTSRFDDRPRRERERERERDGRTNERPEVQGNWKQDRISTADLA